MRYASIGLLPSRDFYIREQSSEQVQKHDSHEWEQGPAGERDEKYLEIIFSGALYWIEFHMNLVIGKSGRCFWVAFYICTNCSLVGLISDGQRVFVA